MSAARAPEISAVIPCLNEAENAANIAAAVGTELTKAGVTYEIIFIDNGSIDGTVDIVKSLCESDPRIRLIVNNQNYGQMRSPTHAIYQATASGAVIGICADFQDPPEMLGEFIARWRSGAMIVLGVRHTEDVWVGTKLLRDVGYGFFKRFADYRVIPGATGFGLYDRRVVDTLREWREPEPFFRGMLVESGYRLETIPYHRPPRAGGTSKNNFFTLVDFAISSLAGSSRNLLRLPLYAAVITGLTAGTTALIALIVALTGHSGWLWLAWAVGQAAFSLLSLFLGLIGEQVRVLAQIARNVPLVIEDERVNFPPGANPVQTDRLRGDKLL
jgi:glycosyltransferase involved in cell wall biosynthesis